MKDKILKDNILFEVIPYPEKWDYSKKQNFIIKISDIIYKNDINIINVPEVILETRNSNRNVSYLKKVPPLEFCNHLKEYYYRNYKKELDFVINIVVPIKEKKYFLDYVDTLVNNGINKLVLVGKDRSDKEYIGYDVLQAAQVIKNKYQDNVTLGGITIFHRKDEHLKIIQKRKSYIEFFISQIIFDKDNFYNLLNNLKQNDISNLLNLNIYLSLAIINSFKEFEFMKFLEVYFPKNILDNISNIKTDIELSNYFNKIIDSLIVDLSEIVFIFRKYNLNIGFNVEHIMYNNLGLSENLIKKLKIKLKNIEFLKTKNLF
jgi:hypothetical protein